MRRVGQHVLVSWYGHHSGIRRDQGDPKVAAFVSPGVPSAPAAEAEMQSLS